jgi:hypothetical protein
VLLTVALKRQQLLLAKHRLIKASRAFAPLIKWPGMLHYLVRQKIHPIAFVCWSTAPISIRDQHPWIFTITETKNTMLLPVGKFPSCFATVANSAVSSKIAVGRGWPTVGPYTCMTSLQAGTAGQSLLPLNLATTLLQVRGGQVAENLLDLSRESYCINQLATYGTLTALVMNSALRLWTSTKFPKEQHSFIPNSFTISTALCVTAGAFTAILFQLLVIYSKSALGMSNDAGYASFKMATALYRKWGFRCFLTELTTFVYSFMISLYNKLWVEAQAHPETPHLSKRVATYIMAGSIILALLGSYHIKNVLNLATKFIFTDAYNHKFA